MFPLPHSPLFACPCLACRSAPSVAVPAASITQTSANVTVAQPADAPAGGWQRYELTACAKGANRSVQANCPIWKQACVFVSAGSTCELKNLGSNAQYEVEVRAAAPRPGALLNLPLLALLVCSSGSPTLPDAPPCRLLLRRLWPSTAPRSAGPRRSPRSPQWPMRECCAS